MTNDSSIEHHRETGCSDASGHGRHALLVSAALLLGLAIACTPTRHTVEPYKSDPAKARELTDRAHEYCTTHSEPGAPQPERPFVTDGCSRWPDCESYVACCVEHDILYWCGGSREARKQADDDYGDCVKQNASAPLGSLMRLGVRTGGHPLFPTSYRWGYGHPYRGGYPDGDVGESADP